MFLCPPDVIPLLPTLAEADLHLVAPGAKPGVVADSFSSCGLIYNLGLFGQKFLPCA